LLKTLTNWLDDRTGLPSLTHRVLNRPVPEGARWGHALGFALASTLVIDVITGLLLMTTYSPSTTMAWGSVYYITYQMDLGWFVRGLHRYASFGSVVLGGLFLLRLVLVGAYRAPREVHWWLAVGTFLLILGLGVTGNILPWDQRGYWAAVVETTIASSTPVVGPMIKKVVVGGSEFGNQTVTRIHGLHVAVLPGLLILMGWAYAVLFGKHGYHGEREHQATEPYWPRQAFYDFSFASFVLGALSILTVVTHGYSLDAPADPASDDYPARPEWYFLPLNLLLHVFEGREYIATMVIPGAAVTGLLLLPLLDKILPRRLSFAAAASFMVTLAGAASVLTGIALYKDSRSEPFQKARAKADLAANRAVFLASRDGIPPEGSSYVLGLDPLHRGGEVFAKKCLGCHSMGDLKPEIPSAPDLKNYGTYAWIRGLLEKPDSPSYFGNTPQCDGMTTWKESTKLSGKQLDDVAAFVASFASIPPDVDPAEWLLDPKVKDHPGRAAYLKECTECHTTGDLVAKGKMQPAPNLFAWGSSAWTGKMIKAPGSMSHYGYLDEGDEKNQKMPGFGGQLTDPDVTTLIRYLKGDYDRPIDPSESPAKEGSKTANSVPRLPVK
jgi:quinol-cytochrome oxidoreductase complex cytochrome b subunit/mono/diheme cytochrome c family protein